MYVIAEHFRGSKKIVCPYWVTYKIYHGDLSAGLRRWFRERAVDDRIDQKDLILFPTLDPPPSKGYVGHWVVVALNIRRVFSVH